METRRLGRTNHQSTVVIFGAAAFWELPQEEADAAMKLVRKYGVNHIDVAPSYGQAEERLGPWLAQHRDEVFLGCKTMERTRQGAWDELHRSLERLQVEHFDLYQLHDVSNIKELDSALGSGGAIEAVLEAREQGLVKHIGITGHGYDAPTVHAAALERFDFDTVMTPLNFVQWADPRFRANEERLLALAAEKDVGVMIIKTFTRAPWGDRPHRYNTWYEPFDHPPLMAQCLRFVLSQSVTALTSPGDLRLLPTVLEAAESYRPLTPDEQEVLVESASDYAPLFTPSA